MLTDLSVALPLLEANVRLNAPSRVVSVLELDWRDPSRRVLDDATGPVLFDLIVASECIYDVDMAQPLLRTMVRG